MRADLLADPILELPAALAAIQEFDACLLEGLGRSHPASGGGLQTLAMAVAGSPLADMAAEAATRAAAGSVDEGHLMALAAARAAVEGAIYDALVTRSDEATGRVRAPAATTSEPEEAQHPNLLASARSWLADLARAGWRGVTHDLVAGSEQLITALFQDVELRRLATVLDGFARELDAVCPGATADQFPERRWADLWTRAMLLTQPGFNRAAPTTPITGRLLPLGVDLTEHPGAASAQVHAVCEPADGSPPRLVRAGATVAKPQTVSGAGVWKLLTPHLSALTALAQGRSIEVEQMAMTATGDLHWDNARAHIAEPADPFATARVALQSASAGAIDPLDRHPVALAEPVFLEGYTVTEDEDSHELTLDLPGYRLRIDADRLPSASPLTRSAVRDSISCLGLLRWDAGSFTVQPLAVTTAGKKQTVAVHAGAWAAGTSDKDGAKADKAADAALTTLRERAGKLLRS